MFLETNLEDSSSLSNICVETVQLFWRKASQVELLTYGYQNFIIIIYLILLRILTCNSLQVKHICIGYLTFIVIIYLIL